MNTTLKNLFNNNVINKAVDMYIYQNYYSNSHYTAKISHQQPPPKSVTRYNKV